MVKRKRPRSNSKNRRGGDSGLQETEIYECIFSPIEFHPDDLPKFYEVRSRLHRAVSPRNDLEKIWVHEIAHAIFEIKKLRRLKAFVQMYQRMADMNRMPSEFGLKHDKMDRLIDELEIAKQKGETQKIVELENEISQVLQSILQSNKVLDSVNETNTFLEHHEILEKIDSMIAAKQKVLIGLTREIELQRAARAQRVREETTLILDEPDGQADPRDSQRMN